MFVIFNSFQVQMYFSFEADPSDILKLSLVGKKKLKHGDGATEKVHENSLYF